jgi:hypothetical protein
MTRTVERGGRVDPYALELLRAWESIEKVAEAEAQGSQISRFPHWTWRAGRVGCTVARKHRHDTFLMELHKPLALTGVMMIQ